MPARGPHDDFESARKVIRAAFSQFTLDGDLDAARARYVSEDIEYVTREGTFGIDRWHSDGEVQLRQWNMEIEVEEIIDAGEGAIVLLNRVRRLDKETGEAVFKAWPANVVRVHGGRVVFFEGYVDRRQALADFGLSSGE
jgi:ketosteroid isomerase-like protein